MKRLLFFIAIAICFSACSRVQYEEKIVLKHDTITRTQLRIDSLLQHDSVWIKETVKGDTVTILAREYHTVYRPSYVHDSIYIAHHDTISAETIKDVPAKLSKWQSFRLGLGDLLLVCSILAVAFGLFKLYLKIKP